MVAAGAITLAKMAIFLEILKSLVVDSTSSSPVNLTLGSGLQISGTVLSVNSSKLLTVPPATATTIGGIEMLGDLTGSLQTAPNRLPLVQLHLQRWPIFQELPNFMVLADHKLLVLLIIFRKYITNSQNI